MLFKDFEERKDEMLKIVAVILQEMMRLWTKMESEMHHGLMKLRH